MSQTAHVSEDRLIDLASGLVAEADEPVLLRHLETCPACEDRFRRTCREAELARLQKPARPVRAAWRGWVAAAAAAVLATGALALWGSRQGAPTPSEYWFPLEGEHVELRTGELTEEAQVFDQAAEAYRAKDAARVVSLLDGHDIPLAQDPLKIALASALVKTGQPQQALAVLDELQVGTVPQPDRDRASWIKVAALLATGRGPEATSIARDLASRPGEFQERARRLTEKN